LVLRGGTFIATAVFGNGNAGDLTVKAQDIELTGTSANANDVSALAAFVAPGGTGKAGNLTIDTDRLSVRDGASVLAGNRGNGDAGNLRVKAREVEVSGMSAARPNLVSALSTEVNQAATNQGGNLTIETERLSVRDGAQIGADVVGTGQGGDLRVIAKEVEVIGTTPQGPSSLSALLIRGATGQGGNVIVETERLSVRDGGQVRVDSFGNGDAGNLTVSAQQVEVIGTTPDSRFPSALGASVFGGTGQGGNITLETERLSVRDGGQVGAVTFGNGDGGTLTVKAQEVELMGTSPNGRFPSGLATSVQAGATGNGGNLTIETSTLIVRDGAAVTVQAAGTAAAGNLVARATNIALDNGTISAETESGTKGNINLAIADSLNLQNNSRISAATVDGTGGFLTIEAANSVILDTESEITSSATENGGMAGDIKISSNSLELRQRSDIQATTQSGNGGNITLETRDLVLLRNNSSISTTAGQAGAGGDGGNITLEAGFVVAVPQENSDITANAFEGRGGNINITTNAIYGLEFRNQLTPLSDITASSQLGINGTVQLNTLNVDPSRGLTELPSALSDPSDQIVAGCPADKGTSFAITGRGGLPEDPRTTLRGVVVMQDWRTAAQTGVERENLPLTNPQPPISTHQLPIVEAQGWLINKQGKVQLVANSSLLSHSAGSAGNDKIDCRQLK
jgi:large exoprotein involved in heme utilization and adhesion